MMMMKIEGFSTSFLATFGINFLVHRSVEGSILNDKHTHTHTHMAKVSNSNDNTPLPIIQTAASTLQLCVRVSRIKLTFSSSSMLLLLMRGIPGTLMRDVNAKIV